MPDYSQCTDEELLLFFYQQTDETQANQAFAELDRRYRPQLILALISPTFQRRFVKLRHMPGLEQKAEELAAEALFRVADTRGRPSARWDPTRKSVGPWIRGILHNVTVSYLRKHEVAVRVESDYRDAGSTDDRSTSLLDNWSDGGSGPAEIAEQQALLAALRECVSALPEELRTLSELLFHQGIKQSAAAELLGMTTPTVTRRKQEIVDRLRRCLKHKGVVD